VARGQGADVNKIQFFGGFSAVAFVIKGNRI
jgi:hypothetical protein